LSPAKPERPEPPIWTAVVWTVLPSAREIVAFFFYYTMVTVRNYEF
jgi:hypothetical protein